MGDIKEWGEERKAQLSCFNECGFPLRRIEDMKDVFKEAGELT